jgi:hypothetical protein
VSYHLLVARAQEGPFLNAAAPARPPARPPQTNAANAAQAAAQQTHVQVRPAARQNARSLFFSFAASLSRRARADALSFRPRPQSRQAKQQAAQTAYLAAQNAHNANALAQQNAPAGAVTAPTAA